MTQPTSFDTSIPVLTEVLQDQAESAEAPPPAAAKSAAAEQFDAPTGDWTQADWDRLERRIAERILQQLQARVDFVLQQCIKDSMAEVLQKALAGLTHDLREGLHQTLDKLITRAVAQELAHLQAQKK